VPPTTDNPERELNRLLRRADWRFLTGTPRPAKVLCRAGGQLREAVAAISGELSTDASAADYDLVVAENPTALTLSELYAALKPGGWCYSEWQVSRSEIPRLTHALATAGFIGIAVYQPWPAAAVLPVYWIPYGPRGPAAYVQARSRLRGGRLRRLIQAFRHNALQLHRGRLLQRTGIVSQRPSAGAAAPPGPAEWLREGWAAWGLGPAPDHLSTLLVTGGPRSISKVVLLGFSEPSAAPALAVKAPRVDQAMPGIRQEGDVLAALHARTGGVQGVPRILTRREIDGVPILAETALAGRPLETALTSRNLPTWSMRVTKWLTAVAVSRALPDVAQPKKRVDSTLSSFVQLFGGVVDPGLLEQTRAVLREIGSLPLVPEQRDFGPWNVLVTAGNGLAVLDWESAELDGLPALDLLYFLTYASLQVDGAQNLERRIAAYRRMLDPGTATGAVRHECLTLYRDMLGISAAQLAPLRLLLWLTHAPSEFRQMTADAGGPPGPDVLRRSLFLAFWAEELRDLTRSPSPRPISRTGR